MQKTIIIPILTLLALVLKSLFGIEIGQDEIQQIADVVLTIILGATTLIGIVKSYSKKIKDKEEQK